ncbi:MAG: FtsX-like permease family protein, partial [Alphaproteobacteria bacterium]
YLVSLGVGLYANVERKQRDLSLLRLIGLSRRDLVVFPLLQALIIAAAGAASAGLLALSVAELVNRLPLGGANPAGGRALCVIAVEHLLLALLVSLLGAALSAAFAGYRAARIEPAEGLRDA